LVEIDERFGSLVKRQVPLFESDVFGVDSLRKIGGHLYA
jgi:hypothetical protein